MAGPILLPTPLASNSLALGQLLSDPLNPYSTSFLSTATSQAIREPSVQSRYKDVVSHDDEGRLVSSLSGRPLPSSQENLLIIQADQMEYRSLKHPTRTFNTIRQDPDARSFLGSMGLRNQPLYYIVGLQQLKNPTFKRAVVNEGPAGASVTEATQGADPKIRLPMHVRRDSAMDLDECGGGTDGIFGLEVRKVVCHVGRKDEPHSLGDIGLEWTYHELDSEDLQLSIGLGKALDAVELRTLAGIVSDDDFSDASYVSDYSDEEGQAGF
ncbi:hypothetical protein K469DRAFT_686772 [Zopfia rhizophila CBS 207.26]|uniref:Uncharacterized protein n=1 Tax=Zopfia rhizophila CBS 207.26 TaxID=1314779 RepID=A0A6A6EVL2_9PEZI|nr:hypothetical protein K469DRAFT_686772 [Zopfia rhizophila CBS 207.26]